MLGLTMGSAMGVGIPIAQSVGADNEEDISCYFWNGLYLSIGIGLVIPFMDEIVERTYKAMSMENVGMARMRDLYENQKQLEEFVIFENS